MTNANGTGSDSRTWAVEATLPTCGAAVTSFGQLAGERDQLRSLVDQLHEGVVAIREDLTVVVGNARASTLLGREVKEGEPLVDPWPAADLHALARELFCPDAELRTIRVAPAPDHTYAVTGVPATGAGTAVLVIADVTEQERRERAEREFVANAAHELRTPVTAIASAVEVLQLGAKGDPAERDRFLELIERQTSRLGRLGQALLTLARAQTLKDTADSGKMAYDQMLAADNPEGNAMVQAVIDALLDQTKQVEQVLAALDLGSLEFEASDSLDDPEAVFQ